MSESPRKAGQNSLLRQAREERGVSQSEVAGAIGVDVRSYRRWENEGQIPGSYTQIQLVKYFGKTSPDELGFAKRTRRTSLSSQQIQLEAELEAAQEGPAHCESSPDSRKLPLQASLAPLPILTQKQRLQLLRGLEQEYTRRLATSLQERVRLELHLQERTDALASSVSLVFHHLEAGKVSSLPPDTSILQVYDRTGRGILILGAPGSGKTTLLFSLAQHLLRRAANDPDQPLALILNLSSWGSSQRSLTHWIGEQCSLIYGISERLCEALIAQEQVQFLLDGLDEMAESARAACIEAINRYRQGHLVPLVVCSRSHEYLSQSARLILPFAIEIQPISRVQVQQVLEQAGEPLAAIRGALQSNAILSDLLTTPLWLSLVILTYQNTTVNDLPQRGTPQVQQQEIFAHYVQYMLKRYQRQRRFSSAQTISSLTWLAQQMQHHQITEFYLETLQENWLSATYARVIYRLIFGSGGGLVGGLIFGLVFGLIGTLVFGLFGGLVYGLAFGAIGGLIGALFFGLVVGPVLGLVGELGSGLTFALLGMLGGGLIIASILGLLGRLTDIKPVENLIWSWKGSGRGLLGGIASGLVFGLIGGLILGQIFGGAFGLLFGVGALLGSGMGGVLLSGLSGTALTENIRLKPNQGIETSGRNSLRVFLVYSLLAGLINGLALGLIFGLPVGLVSGPIFGVSAGLGGGLAFGGKVYLHHYILRWFLLQSRTLPWKTIAFLEEAKRCILLQRVGGGYRFIHPLLQEYFASLRSSQPFEKVSDE